ncbi:chemotaxis protein CheB [Luteolibacter sp. Populi]|uniref:chemotaxis protein CheB n=1 Tax=Luteolibacter sp. Populi TaxID=3230487 RepID=UPI00346796DD
MSGDETREPRAVVIGASVGAIGALSEILPALPADYALAVLVVVHIPPDRSTGLPHLFAPRCAMAVKEAEDKERIRSGTIYFAPPNYHLLVEPDFTLAFSNDEPVLYSRPAIDVLFESAADAYGTDLTGVVLTGASSDGAHGLHAVVAAGGTALVQDPDTAEGGMMPRSALAACPEALSLTLQAIAAELQKLSASPLPS